MDKVYKKVELVGSSGESIEKAIETALSRANKTLRNLDWFEVKELRGLVEGGKAKTYQVTLEVGFRLEE
ncbi:dodecin [Calidithermus roseus]|uniref:Dodecin n=1 Tax=Calidithermus roseus TaxID=1644118 RepID=A0A399EKL6_9DEIN|nr:dodecin [Calidithermus roseus]RIH82711.1 Dodecin [Calidithermus roseus]